MAFTDALDVDIGDATKASDYDTLADNPEWLRDKSDIEHDFDISTGDGKHKPIVSHPNEVTENTTVSASYNALSVGTITVASGVTVTLESGAIWKIV